MAYPKELSYTASHEWVRRLENGNVQIGITDHAQSELGDIVFIALPQPGDVLAAGERFADVESVKAVSDIFAPFGGTVAAVNEALADDPAQLNSAPYEAWIMELAGAGEGEALLDAQAYEKLVEEA